MFGRRTFGLLLGATVSCTLVIMAAQQVVQSPSGPPTVFRQAADGAKLIDGSTDFAINLFKQLSQPGQNVFFSPTSISVALAMTYMGCRSNTAEQMKNVLGFSEVDPQHLHDCFEDLHTSLRQTEDNYKLHVANRLYGHEDYNFLQDFLQGTKKHYHAEMQSVNFGDDATRQEINKWVEQQTQNKIQNLLAEPLSALVRLILVNAIYFKGDWLNKFDVENTKKDKFHLSNGDTVDVDMMFMKRKFNASMIRDLKTHVLELPYKGESVSMVILLPEKRDGLPALEAGLTLQHLKDIKFGRAGGMDVNVWLPRFRLEQAASLAENLAALGMPEAFDMTKADLSGMDGTRNLFISKVVHKAFIEVNEEGSEAAAATAVIAMLRSMPRTLEFRADHPFLFLIRDNRSGAVMFMGKLEKPEPASARDEL